jgi:indolepyruvate decarboxylase
MMAQSLSTMAQYVRNPVIILIANGIFGYEQFLVDPTFFTSPMQPPRPYVVLRQWDFVKFAAGLGLPFAREDAALTAVKAINGPAMIIARVDPRDLPAELP